MLRRISMTFAPPACWSCGGSMVLPAALCDACERRLPWLGQALSAGPETDIAWAALEFCGPARDLVHALKFRAATGLAAPMAAQMAQAMPAELLEQQPALTPVPAHPLRQRRRGFDPAQLLARELAGQTGLALVPQPLRRLAGGGSQREADRIARLTGDHVRLAIRRRLEGPVLIIDDVWTTGGTLRACAVALAEAGADWVGAATYAKVLDTPARPGTIQASEITHERSAMRVDVKGLNVPIDDDLREQVDKRFGTISKQVSELATLDLTLSEERNPSIKTPQRAEANLHLKGVTLHARAQAAEMRSAIGQVADELQRQVIKRRDKIRGHRKVGTPTIRLAGAPEEV